MLKATKRPACKVGEKAHKGIRKGDKVMATTGNNRGLVGTVVRRSGEMVTVTGFNIKKKHVRKSSANPQGGIVDVERPIHISNLCLCSPTNEPVKMHKRVNKNGEKELYFVEGGKEVVHRNMKKSS